MLQDADTMFNVIQGFFELPTNVKKQFDFADQGKYFGHKSVHAEVIDGKGTKDRNEIYNVRNRPFLWDALPWPY